MKPPLSPQTQGSWDTWLNNTHQAASTALREWAQGATKDDRIKAQLGFIAEQWIAASQPTNFLPTNPTALRRAVETNFASLEDGLQLLLQDLSRGRISNTNEFAFQLGENIATTPGAVIFCNPLIELIQYAPTTPQVGARPILLVPPFINKYYILDLTPESSLIRFLLEAGHTVFIISWRNPEQTESKMGWDDYLKLGVLDAINAVLSVSRSQDINILGFCVGGTLLATALAVLAHQNKKPAHSLTLMTSLLDFTEVGQLGLFVDKVSVAYREATLGLGGVLPGRELSTTFSFLRANDLVWNYVDKSYLQGEPPPPFDLLYWNADGTNLPGPLYAWYLRNMYLENNLRRPGYLRCLNTPVDLGLLDMPCYIFAAREDHIVPWQTAFTSASLVSGDTRRVLGASGHIAGSINPVKKNRRSYWAMPDQTTQEPDRTEEWLSKAQEYPGSWWNDWKKWLAVRQGKMITAPKKLGNQDYPALMPAPGNYVKTRI